MSEQPDWPVRLPPLSLAFVNDEIPDSTSPEDGDTEEFVPPDLRLVQGGRQ
jgi:hypothetical protein